MCISNACVEIVWYCCFASWWESMVAYSSIRQAVCCALHQSATPHRVVHQTSMSYIFGAVRSDDEPCLIIQSVPSVRQSLVQADCSGPPFLACGRLWLCRHGCCTERLSGHDLSLVKHVASRGNNALVVGVDADVVRRG